MVTATAVVMATNVVTALQPILPLATGVVVPITEIFIVAVCSFIHLRKRKYDCKRTKYNYKLESLDSINLVVA